jgi:hypothetical protein
MCTVSVIPLDDGRAGPMVRLAFNRDESRERPAALPPQARHFGHRLAILPVDPVSGGTWIGVNERGLAMALMNTYPVPLDREVYLANLGRYASRGTIIPSLLHHSRLDRAVGQAAALDPSAYPPFRLILLDREQFVELVVTGNNLTVSELRPIERPIMYTSSGLGDNRVEAPRRDLFEAKCAIEPKGPAAQDAFHRHQWPDRPHLSVCMSRPEARTVSLAVVEIGPAYVRMEYFPESPHRVATPIVTELVRA